MPTSDDDPSASGAASVRRRGRAGRRTAVAYDGKRAARPGVLDDTGEPLQPDHEPGGGGRRPLGGARSARPKTRSRRSRAMARFDDRSSGLGEADDEFDSLARDRLFDDGGLDSQGKRTMSQIVASPECRAAPPQAGALSWWEGVLESATSDRNERRIRTTLALALAAAASASFLLGWAKHGDVETAPSSLRGNDGNRIGVVDPPGIVRRRLSGIGIHELKDPASASIKSSSRGPPSSEFLAEEERVAQVGGPGGGSGASASGEPKGKVHPLSVSTPDWFEKEPVAASANAAGDIASFPQNERGMHRLEFVHIAETGGNSIELAASRVGIAWGICKFNLFEEYWSKFTLFKEYWLWESRCKPIIPYLRHIGIHQLELDIKVQHLDDWKCGQEAWAWHCPPFNYEARRDVNKFEGADTFTVVRNPYSLMISEYYNFFQEKPHAEKEITKTTKGGELNDPEFMNRWIVNAAQRAIDHGLCHFSHCIAQHNFVYRDGRRFVDHVLKMEELDDEFPKLMEKYGLPVQLERTNSRRGWGNLGVEDLSREAIDKINEWAGPDFEYFGYEKLDPSRAREFVSDGVGAPLTNEVAESEDPAAKATLEARGDATVVGEVVVGEAVVVEAVVGEAVVEEAVVGEAVVGEAVMGEAVVGAAVVGEGVGEGVGESVGTAETVGTAEGERAIARGAADILAKAEARLTALDL